MKSLLLGLAMATTLISCQTMENQKKFEMTQTAGDSVIHCALPLPSDPQNIVTFELKFSNREKSIADVRFKLHSEQSYRNITSKISDDGIVILSASEKEVFAVSVRDIPHIARLENGTTKSQSTTCVKLFAHSNSQKPATCQATGTPAEGWYQAGRIIQHTHTCSSELLTCGSAPIPGWYVQKKLKQTKIKSDPCGRQKTRPSCQSEGTVTGWFLNKNLIARDEGCREKSIECSAIGTTDEGWVTFERSSPQLLLAESCQPSRNISYLAR